VGESVCAACGARIRWVMTEHGRRIPLDPDPHEDGTVVAVTTPDGKPRARVLTGDALPAQEPAWRPHWVTCPAAPEHRARKRRSRSHGPLCAVCRAPMDPDLARLEGWATHPSCDPGHTRPTPTPAHAHDIPLIPREDTP
jgi:hypothetical protein